MSHPVRVFVARQPILDARQRIAGYELLYRSAADAQQAEFGDPDIASLQTLLGVFVNVGTDVLMDSRLGFLNVSAELLCNDLIEALPKDRVVLELLELDEIDPSLRTRCRQLRKQGFRIALDDYVPGDEREELVRDVDYVKVDLQKTHPRSLRPLFESLRRRPVTTVAEKVETRESFDRCRALGFDLFQGFHFARPKTLSGMSVDPARTAIFELIRLLRDEDLDRIEEEFKRHAALGLNLLRLVNCVALARAEKIGTLRQALVLLGTQQLERWLLMLLFAGGDPHGASNLLLQTAATRGRVMELLVRRQDGEEAAKQSGVGERAFIAGLLSLVDVLLEARSEQILERLHVDDEIRGALLAGEGRLGRLLALVIHLERGEFNSVASLLPLLDLRVEELVRLQVEAYRWAGAVERAGELER